MWTDESWRADHAHPHVIFTLWCVTILSFFTDILHVKHLGVDMQIAGSVLWLLCYEILPGEAEILRSHSSSVICKFICLIRSGQIWELSEFCKLPDRSFVTQIVYSLFVRFAAFVFPSSTNRGNIIIMFEVCGLKFEV